MKYILLPLIRLYQALFSFDHGFLGKVFPNFRICIYYPSCSEYGYQSIKRYGSIIGGFLTLKRVISCGPWSTGGNNPIKIIRLEGITKILSYF